MDWISRQVWLGFGCLVLLVAAGWVTAVDLAAEVQGTPPVLSLEEMAGGFTQPVGIAHTGRPDDTRLFIIEKLGTIKILHPDGSVNPTPFLDLEGDLSTEGERGLLGMAFHPEFAQNSRFFIYYTRPDGDIRISEFALSTHPDEADPASELIMLEIEHSAEANHNGGDIHFGPDGYLYFATGDRGGGGDNENSSQKRDNLLGSMIRIDVDNGGLPPDCGRVGNYTIPADNPFVTTAGACNEIWAHGLRNPWRFSFDPLTGDLFIGDVGESMREEINFQPANSAGGENYGWRCYEGDIIFDATLCDLSDDFVPPIFAYPRSEGLSVTGGRVYRGHHFPDMIGNYFFMDYGTGQTWSIRPDGGAGWQVDLIADFSVSVVGFGVDHFGDLVVADLAGNTIYRLIEEYGAQINVAAPIFVVDGDTLTYTLSVENLGSESLTNLKISSQLPAGATYGSGGTLVGDTVELTVASLASGATETLTFDVTIDQTVVLESVEVTSDELNAPIPADTNPQTVYLSELNTFFLPIVD